MRSRDITDLLVLAAVWGGSFLFIRMAVPEFGPAALIEVRVGLASLALMPLLLWQRKLPLIARHWKAIFVVGTFNATLPFILYAYAAQQLGAGFLSISNAVTPMWGAIIAWVWLRDRLPPMRIAGMVIGFVGIVVLVWDKFDFSDGGTGLAVVAALLAPICYGVSANCTKRYLAGVDALTNAAGSMIAASLTLLPFAIWTWPDEPVPFQAWSAAVLLALACTGFAYVLFFRLIASVGPTRAVSVTFLVPIFGVFWGAFLLDEVVTANIVTGAGIVLIGTALALGLVRLPRLT
jgi:drug/metabolite transporter (DMT)-like permease